MSTKKPVVFEDLDDCLQALMSKWSHVSNRCSAFFTFGRQGSFKTCFHVMNKLPDIIMDSSSENGDSNVFIKLHWNGIRVDKYRLESSKKKKKNGWDDIPAQDSYAQIGYSQVVQANKTYITSSCFVLENVRSIRAFEWGFVVSCDSGLGMCLVNNTYLHSSKDISDQTVKEKTGLYWQIPWGKVHAYREHESPVFTWGSYESADEDYLDELLSDMSRGRTDTPRPKKHKASKDAELDLL